MLHVLIGEDDYSRQQALEEIKKGIGDPTACKPVEMTSYSAGTVSRSVAVA